MKGTADEMAQNEAWETETKDERCKEGRRPTDRIANIRPIFMGVLEGEKLGK